jgi:hypothetical protein
MNSDRELVSLCPKIACTRLALQPQLIPQLDRFRKVQRRSP